MEVEYREEVAALLHGSGLPPDLLGVVLANMSAGDVDLSALKVNSCSERHKDWPGWRPRLSFGNDLCPTYSAPNRELV